MCDGSERLLLNNLVEILRDHARENPDGVCAWDASCADVERDAEHRDTENANSNQTYKTITNEEVWKRSCKLAWALARLGVGRGGHCASDMGTCAQMLYLMCAAAIGGFSVVALNTRLSTEEKQRRLSELPWSDAQSMPILHADDIDRLLAEDKQPGKSNEVANATEIGNPDLFDLNALGVVMFTSGTTGKPKAATLPWRSLLGAAASSNAYLNEPGKGVWQLSLPMFHVGGLEIAFRSILNSNPFILYAAFHTEQILRDARAYGATHVSVVNETLQRLMDADTSGVLKQYHCLLLGGAAPNPFVLKRAAEQGLRVYTSYGMTETCSQVASRCVSLDADGNLASLALQATPGYELKILHPDTQTGLGALCVKGPGVFDGYLNAKAQFTDDGGFLTGDTARESNDGIVIAERTGDMFVSGGENVYPEEIRLAILQYTNARDAYVFGAKDTRWGRRPVAFVEAARSHSEVPGSHSEAQRNQSESSLSSAQVYNALQGHLSKLNMPEHIFVLPQFPRQGIGKTDRNALKRMWEHRLDVRKVDLWCVEQPMKHPMQTAKTLVKTRKSLIVQVKDAQGQTGLGEDVAFATDWYLPETLKEDEQVLKDTLIPYVLKHVFVNPDEVSRGFEEEHLADNLPLARAAIENAMWDLYCKIKGVSLARELHGRVEDYARRAAESDAASSKPYGEKHDTDSVTFYVAHDGVVIGIKDIDATLKDVDVAVKSGYSRVKLKIRPGHDVEIVRAVRKAYPNITLVVDANQSYDEENPTCLPAMQALDELGVACIEEPLVVKSGSERVSSHNRKIENHNAESQEIECQGGKPQDQSLFNRLDALQQKLPHMTIFLDESWYDARELRRQLELHPHLHGVVMKLAKFGGIAPALDFYVWARAHGIGMWVGGMYDYGISKSVHAAFSTLPHIDLPGDLSDSSTYFAHDICDPPFTFGTSGQIILPAAPKTNHGFGIGRALNHTELEKIVVCHCCLVNE